jgi:(p)ppGpp synthase/HD superfamily hydrolase
MAAPTVGDKMAEVGEIMRAANFAAIKHRKQKRKDPEGTPYINHPIGVANYLTEVQSRGVPDLAGSLLIGLPLLLFGTTTHP